MTSKSSDLVVVFQETKLIWTFWVFLLARQGDPRKISFLRKFSTVYTPDQGESVLKTAYEVRYFDTYESRLKK